MKPALAIILLLSMCTYHYAASVDGDPLEDVQGKSVTAAEPECYWPDVKGDCGTFQYCDTGNGNTILQLSGPGTCQTNGAAIGWLIGSIIALFGIIGCALCCSFCCCCKCCVDKSGQGNP